LIRRLSAHLGSESSFFRSGKRHKPDTAQEEARMANELVSLRIMVISPSPNDRAMFRNAAASARLPIELLEGDGEAAAWRSIATGADLAFFDMELGGQAVARMAQAARAVASRPLTVALCPPGVSGVVPTDGQANRPLDEDEARRLIVGASRLRLPSRVLLVDDSPVMRGIVRKVLAATRFPLHVAEAGEGGEALALARTAISTLSCSTTICPA
jgi:hypothetical protein